MYPESLVLSVSIFQHFLLTIAQDYRFKFFFFLPLTAGDRWPNTCTHQTVFSRSRSTDGHWCYVGSQCVGSKSSFFMTRAEQLYILCPVCVSSSANLAKATMSQFCTMPAGERKKCAAAICREVHGANGMILELRLSGQKHTAAREHPFWSGFKMSGLHSPALAINNLMGWFIIWWKSLCRCPFQKSISGWVCGWAGEGRGSVWIMWRFVTAGEHSVTIGGRGSTMQNNQNQFSATTIARFPWQHL